MASLVRQIRGVSYKPADLHEHLDDSSIVLLRANNIRDGEINFDDVVFVDRKRVAEQQLLRRGDILICASSGSKELVGKAARMPSGIECTFGAFCKVARPCKEDDSPYLGFYFQSPSYKRQISDAALGANINNIRNEHIDNLVVAWPEEGKRQRIVSVFKRISSIIAARRAQLSALDELVKARFVEMFGDPEAGTCHYRTEKLSTLTSKISDGIHSKPVYTEAGRPFLSVININKGLIDFSKCKYVSEDAYQTMIRSTNPEKGDVLYTKVGATYGIPAYVDTDQKFCLYVSVCLIKPHHERINARFLAAQMAMPSVKHQADARIKGIGVPDLHLNQIREFDIVCPPRALQDQFVDFAARVEKTKASACASLTETQTLFDSLMQEYFG